MPSVGSQGIELLVPDNRGLLQDGLLKDQSLLLQLSTIRFLQGFPFKGFLQGKEMQKLKKKQESGSLLAKKTGRQRPGPKRKEQLAMDPDRMRDRTLLQDPCHHPHCSRMLNLERSVARVDRATLFELTNRYLSEKAESEAVME